MEKKCDLIIDECSSSSVGSEGSVSSSLPAIEMEKTKNVSV